MKLSRLNEFNQVKESHLDDDLFSEYEHLKQQYILCKEELNQFKNRFDNSSELLVTLNQQGKIIYTNKIIEKITGRTHNEMIGRSFFSWVLDKKALKFIMDEVVKHKKIIGFEFSMISDKKQEILFLGNLYHLNLQNDEENYFYLEARDISLNTNYENELEHVISLRTQELDHTIALLKSSLESPKDMIILAVDKDYKYLYFNQNHKKIMKSSYGTNIKIGMNIFDCMSLEIDKTNLKKDYDQAIQGVSHTTFQEYGDLKKCYYESNFNPIYDKNHQIMGMCVFAQDITKRMNMQNQLIEQKKYMDLFFNQSLTGFFIMMMDEPVIWNDTINKEETLDYIFKHESLVKANKSYLKQYGYTLKDVIGKTPEKDFEHDIKQGKKAWRKMLDKKYVHLTTHERKKDGTPIVIEGDYICMFDEENRFIGHFGTQLDVTKRTERIEKIEYLSKHDSLTGLYNRKYFMDMYHKMDQEKNLPLGLILVDINGLKLLNDAYGPAFGDEQIKYVAKIISSVTKKPDLVARLGGDEFAILIKKTNAEHLCKIKELIQKKVKTRSSSNIKLSITAGYELRYDLMQDRNEFLQTVENRLYAHKSIDASSSRNNAIKAIIKTLNHKYQTEKRHVNRVAKYCIAIGQKLELNQDQLHELEMSGLYHDIGKISIPDSILNKPGRLTDDEYEIMKTHAEIGYQILRAADQYSDLAIHARHHHERWDGKGYPTGLSGENIPLYSRIIGCVDAYEAMTSDRPYRKKMSKADAIQEIIRHSGAQFDPNIAKILVVDVLGSKWNDK